VIKNDNESAKLLLRSGGVATAIKVKEKWPNVFVQQAVHLLMVPLLEELTSWNK
jgi:hypothetical protein